MRKPYLNMGLAQLYLVCVARYGYCSLTSRYHIALFAWVALPQEGKHMAWEPLWPEVGFPAYWMTWIMFLTKSWQAKGDGGYNCWVAACSWLCWHWMLHTDHCMASSHHLSYCVGWHRSHFFTHAQAGYHKSGIYVCCTAVRTNQCDAV